MATLPVQLDEEALIRDLIADIDLPEGVNFDRIVLASEWTGEPCWQVHFVVAKKKTYTKAFVRRVGDIRRELHERLRHYSLEKWAFVNFDEAR
jgi:hypothetical protein